MSAHKTIWTTFAAWTLVNLTDTGSGLAVSSGYTDGTATIQYEATGWTAGKWRMFTLAGVRQEATDYQFRFRVATTQGGLAAATWSTYEDDIDVNGNVAFNLSKWVRNNPAWNVGPWIEIEVLLEGS